MFFYKQKDLPLVKFEVVCETLGAVLGKVGYADKMKRLELLSFRGKRFESEDEKAQALLYFLTSIA